MAALVGDDDVAKLQALNQRPFQEQAVWVLNAFWLDVFQDAPEKREQMWDDVVKCSDIVKKDDGCELDEFQAHILLEKKNATVTVRDMRTKLTEMGITLGKMTSFVEVLIIHMNLDWHRLVNAPQAANAESAKLIEQAQTLVKTAQASVAECTAAEEAAHKAEEEVRAAELEAKEAEAVLNREAEAHQAKIDKLTADSENMDFGIVKRNRSKAELAQLQASDPLPLQRARINQGAVVRRLAKATKKAEEATAAAVAARVKAEEDYDAAKKNLEEVKAQCSGSGDGSLWWMDRELEEAKKYMSQKQLAKLAAKSS